LLILTVLFIQIIRNRTGTPMIADKTKNVGYPNKFTKPPA
jgi:hypothetical protein